MKLRDKEYKISSILLTLFVIAIFIWNTDLKKDEELEIYKKELIERESWLLTEMKNISTFMDLKNSEYDHTNREVWFYSWYYGYEFDKDRLLALYSHLKKTGWVDVTGVVDREDYNSRTAGNSDTTIENIHILCNNKATILLYITDMQNDEEYKDTEVRTLVELLYDYSLPCYDLNEQ